MTISEIWTTIGSLGGASIVIILLSIIKIKPLEISVWNWLFRKIGAAFNGEVLDNVNNLNKKLDKHIEENEADKISEIRRHILAFDSSLYKADRDEYNKIFYHTEEEFNDVLDDIDMYIRYCDRHPEYPNSKCLMAIEHIRKIYLHCKETNSFI